MSVVMGHLGAIYAPVGTTGLTNEPLAQAPTGGEYVLADSQLRVRRAFLPDVTPGELSLSSGTVVEVLPAVGAVRISGGTPPYTLSAPNGRVWDLAPAVGFLNWQIRVDQQLQEVTTLGMEHRRFRRIVRGWEAQAERFWVDADYLLHADPSRPRLEGGPWVVAFFVDAEPSQLFRYVGFAYVEGVQIEAAKDQTIREPIRFRGTGSLHFRANDN